MTQSASRVAHLRSNPIQELRRILRDQYSVGSIMKELVQNADDAGATEVHFSTVASWPPGTHPLLIGPALLVLNNGEFRPQDAEGITRLDEGAKGAEAGSIGKYGLGMKSVFHLCEGLFYAASANQPGSEGAPLLSLLNPWEEGGPHDAWNDLDRAHSAVIEQIENWDHGCDRWFCLVIPLRMREHLAGAEAIVQGQFPSLADAQASLDIASLAGLVPLLRTVTRFALWEANHDGAHVMLRAAEARGAGLQRAYGSESRALEAGETVPLRASMVEPDSDTPLLFSAGVERLLDDVSFDRLKRDERWPKNYGWDPKTGRSHLKEKGEPHCAVVLSRFPHGAQRLDVCDAVFLPLSKGRRDRVDGDLDGEYQVMLHGQFFLDAGRQQLFQSGESEESIQRDWNERLMSQGVLPLVPQALHEFVSTWSAEPATVEAITRTLEFSGFFREHRQHICSEHCWLAPIEPGLDRPAWRLEASSRPYFTFPNLAERAQVARELFTALEDICRETCLVEASAPRLASTPPTAWRDAPELLERLFKSIDPDKLTDAAGLDLLTDFLHLAGRDLPHQASSTLAGKLQAAISEQGIRALERVGENLRRMVDRMPEGSWVGLGPIDSEASAIFRDLNRLAIHPAILPSTLVPDPAPFRTSTLSLDEAEIALAWLAETASERDRRRTAAVSLRLVEATKSDIDAKRERLGRYAVWMVRDGAEDGTSLVSWDELAHLLDEGTLFGSGSAHLTALQRALRGTTLLSLYTPQNASPFDTLFALAQPPTCDGPACVRLLSRRPPLAPSPDRVDLLNRLKFVTATDRPRDLAAVRYLLHGAPEHAEDTSTPLLTRQPGTKAGHLSAIAERALEELDSGWRWVAPELWEVLTHGEQQAFGITSIEATAIEGLLKEAGTGWIAELGLSDSEITALLLDINDHDVWVQLPVHRTVSGEHTSLAGLPAYLASEYQAPPQLRAIATIVRDDGHLALRQKYVNQGIQVWGPESAVEVALKQGDPSAHALDILNAVGSLRDEGTSQELRDALHTAPWLRTRTGQGVAPKDFIVIDGLEDHLEQLLADPELHGTFFSLPDLAEHLRGHSGIGQLRSLKVLPDRWQSAEALAVCLSEVPRYRIGPLPGLPADADGLDMLISAFSGLEPNLLPVLPTLRSLRDSFQDARDKIAGTVLPSIRSNLPVGNLLRCVTALSEGIESASTRVEAHRLVVLVDFLKALWIRCSEVKGQDLRALKLPDRDGRARAVTELTTGQSGIDPAYLIHRSLEEIVAGYADHLEVPATGPHESSDQPAKDDPTILINYVRAWESFVPRAQLGALLALFGDEEPITNEAGALLSPHTVDGIRSTLAWEPYALAKREEEVAESMERQRFVFRVAREGSTELVPNLLGEFFEAPVGGAIESIFVGSLWPTPPKQYLSGTHRVKLVTLREFDPSHETRRRLEEVIFESVRLLLKEVYLQRPDNLDQWWSEVSEVGQLALEITQEQLLKNAWFYFNQLGDHRIRSLEGMIREYDDLSDRAVEIKKSTTQAAQKRLREVQERLETLPKELRHLLTTDEEVQHQILATVRSKMEDFQYSADSVPFELFQNADDAAREIADMLPGEASPRTAKIEFVLERDALTVRHWGRPINRFTLGRVTPEQGRRRGYDRDLKKMLILAASDKREREGLVTGKFGLGFKSVFFLTDRPQVVSGELAFEVLGGFFPAQLDAAAVQAIQSPGDRATKGDGGSTIVRLPLREKSDRVAHFALQGFAEHLPISLVFARHLTECTISADGMTTTVVLHETPPERGSDPGISVCNTSASEHLAEGWGRRALVFRCESGSSVLFDLGPRGLRALPDGTPTFWVGAPTVGAEGAQLAVNGPFEVDVGRNQLASSEENLDLATRIGVELGRRLLELSEWSEDWPALQRHLDLIETVSAEEFWISLWQLTSSRAVRSDELLRNILWAEDAGVYALVEQRKALPTNLPSPHDALTGLPLVRGVLEGVIDSSLELAAQVLTWPHASEAWVPGSLVSAKRTWSVLSDLIDTDRFRTEHITLVDFVTAELSGARQVSPETAELLGQVMTSEHLTRWAEEEPQTDEIEGLRDFLQTLQFKAADGSYMVVTDLLSMNSRPDEVLRASFAPDSRRLATGYGSHGVDFFLACRAELQAGAELLARWTREADTVDRRTAALRYLLQGDLSHGVKQQLRAHDSSSWLDDIPAQCLAPFSDLEELNIKAGLARDTASFDSWWARPEVHEAGLLTSSTQDALERICEWWDRERDERLKEFDRRTYPTGHFFDVHDTAPDNDAGRAEWLKLFLLGSLQTYAWGTPDQNRSFIGDIEKRGWVGDLAAVQNAPGRWFESFLEYIDQQETELLYYQHMRHLMGLGVIARHLDSYVELFLGSDLIRTDFSMTAITIPRSSEFFQGGGPDGPPISSVLGIGQCMIMRELVRHGILTSPKLHQHCYVPFQRTRDLVRQLGGPDLESPATSRWERSRKIHEFLEGELGEDAHFRLSFDIPLMIIAEDAELRSELLGYHA